MSTSKSCAGPTPASRRAAGILLPTRAVAIAATAATAATLPPPQPPQPPQAPLLPQPPPPCLSAGCARGGFVVWRRRGAGHVWRV
eukprot:354823-Chlamydomonas_euryale.AAC.3